MYCAASLRSYNDHESVVSTSSVPKLEHESRCESSDNDIIHLNSILFRSTLAPNAREPLDDQVSVNSTTTESNQSQNELTLQLVRHREDVHCLNESK